MTGANAVCWCVGGAFSAAKVVTSCTSTPPDQIASPQPAMSIMTLSFHPFHDPYNFTNAHSLPENPPYITAPISLSEPAFPANYDSWGLAPTLSPAGFHHPTSNIRHWPRTMLPTCHLLRPPMNPSWETHLIPLSLRLDCPSNPHLSSHPRLSVSCAPTVSFGADPSPNLSISGPL